MYLNEIQSCKEQLQERGKRESKALAERRELQEEVYRLKQELQSVSSY